ncbi:MAG: MerR family transcriptional regulator [Vicinamibacteria bacterium]
MVERKIPNKLFFKIGEVCELTDIQPYVLRYWETEFPTLAPAKNSSGQRIYRRRDIETVIRIKELLYGEGFTVAGARKKIEQEQAGRVDTPVSTAVLETAFEGAEPDTKIGPTPSAAAIRAAMAHPPPHAPTSSEHAVARDDKTRAILQEVKDELKALLKVLDRK